MAANGAIHPQYIIALADAKKCRFGIKEDRLTDTFVFQFCVYHDDYHILSKIKKRFDSGKIVRVAPTGNNYALKITANIQRVIEFFRKNQLLDPIQHQMFIRWAYLYQKFVIEQDVTKHEKESRRIMESLDFFGLRDRVQPLVKTSGEFAHNSQ